MTSAASSVTRGKKISPRLLRGFAPVSLVALTLAIGALIAGSVPINPVYAVRAPFWLNETRGVGLLGTDSLGRDMLSRLLMGGAISVVISFLSTVLGLALGTIAALLTVQAGPVVSWGTKRLMDLQLAIPFIILAMFVASVLPSSPALLVGLLALPAWVYAARILRAALLEEVPKDYVVAARAMGVGPVRLALRYLVPAIGTTIAVVGGNLFASLVLLEATLSFLGIGLAPPAPTLGGMIYEGREYMTMGWWISVFPGIVLMLIVGSIYAAVNAMEGGRDV